ncbi:hypothetical protein LR69_03378 [Geobacillus sp. BCO2]|nr:hypothetical protein LR69_03378 [Geobacillus sp. BCO2]
MHRAYTLLLPAKAKNVEKTTKIIRKAEEVRSWRGIRFSGSFI